ncbi:hypothetical protein BX600DRAFT_148797 [Xylariales sp. PMI_506]|nr:hypothetical protein BX600DRAFT_148797 [Xylariales sp. PMI_506]
MHLHPIRTTFQGTTGRGAKDGRSETYRQPDLPKSCNRSHPHGCVSARAAVSFRLLAATDLVHPAPPAPNHRSGIPTFIAGGPSHLICTNHNRRSKTSGLMHTSAGVVSFPSLVSPKQQLRVVRLHTTATLTNPSSLVARVFPGNISTGCTKERGHPHGTGLAHSLSSLKAV